MLNELLDMLTYSRPAGSDSEREFLERYVLTLPNVEYDHCKPYGNWHVQIGESRILWSCHTDTVAHQSRRQMIKYRRNSGIISLHKREKVSNCLGADDTAGCYILRQMILRGIPGHYVFHACEERGCKGSEALASQYPDWIRESFDYAIALDRGGKSSIITHQTPGRTASDHFALALGDALPTLKYRADDTGIYTDTVSYADLISECSNLSVGYEHCHSWRETLDANHVMRLLEALCALDQSKLTCERTPGDYDRRHNYWWDREYPGIVQVDRPVVCDDYAWDLDEDLIPADDDPIELDTRERAHDMYLSADFARIMAIFNRKART